MDILVEIYSHQRIIYADRYLASVFPMTHYTDITHDDNKITCVIPNASLDIINKCVYDRNIKWNELIGTAPCAA